jgi:hypothetical protein
MRVLRVVGIESEAEVAYAALQLMFVRDLDRLGALPGVQAEALRAAFGASSVPVERGLPGAATLFAALRDRRRPAAPVPAR